jgi:hypothetical protein
MTFVFASFDLPTLKEQKDASNKLITLHLKILNCRNKIKNNKIKYKIFNKY